MSRLGRQRTLVAGAVSPLLAAGAGLAVYLVLTRASADRDADFVFRLMATAVAMTVPFLITCGLALADRRRGSWGKPSLAGLLLAFVSLGLLWYPIGGVVARSRQAANLALEGVAAPEIDTVDINGERHRLSDYRDRVVLLNIWATWCPPCLEEMPKLQRLDDTRGPAGLVVLGLSDEDAELQRSFAEKVEVRYPLLTVEGSVPGIFRDIQRYPAIFLVDRHGKLRPAPGTDEPFESLTQAVDALLSEPSGASRR